MRIRLVALIAVVSALLVGCSLFTAAPASEDTSPTSAYPMTVVDDMGREVVVESEPARIVSLAPSNTEILFALGLGDKVVGVTNFCNYPPEVEGIDKIGDSFNVNIEAVVALDPDLVLGIDSHTEVADRLAELGIATYLLAPQSIEDTAKAIERVGVITGVPERGREVAEDMRQSLEAVAERLEGIEDRPRVLVLVDPAELWAVGPGTFLDEMIRIAGGENVAADIGQQYAQLSEEAVVARDPEVIILTWPAADQIRAREAFAGLSAVVNDRIYVVDGDTTSRPGPRLIEGLKEIVRAVHPDVELP